MINHKDISFIRVGGYVMPVIFGTHTATMARKKAREKAIENKKHFQEVYALGRAFTCDYTFASTVHKSQGSEFNRVWIDKTDILKSSMNNNYRQYARMMYVALSRAKKMVFILT
jgi:ATP-dependent exoDNAse (exonuclease V) alpha subunit